jgi:hypothetical protein
MYIHSDSECLYLDRIAMALVASILVHCPGSHNLSLLCLCPQRQKSSVGIQYHRIALYTFPIMSASALSNTVLSNTQVAPASANQSIVKKKKKKTQQATATATATTTPTMTSMTLTHPMSNHQDNATVVMVGKPSKQPLAPDDTRAQDRCVKFLLKWLLELKCPYKKTFYGRIKLYYYDQITGIQGLENYLVSDFVVRIVKYTCIQRYVFNAPYWMNVLKPKMLHWYHKIFVPRLIWKQMGLLEKNETEPVLRIKSPSKTFKARIQGSTMGGAAEQDATALDFNLGEFENQIQVSADMRTSTPAKQQLVGGKRTYDGKIAATTANKKPRTTIHARRASTAADLSFNMGDFI